MTGSKDLVVDVQKVPSMPTNVELGDASSSKVLGLVKVVISHDLTIEKVMLVETLAYNLLSVGQLCNAGYTVIFNKYHVTILSLKHSMLLLLDFVKTVCMWLISRKIPLKSLHV